MVFSVYLPSNKLSSKRELLPGISLVMQVLVEINVFENKAFLAMCIQSNLEIHGSHAASLAFSLVCSVGVTTKYNL